MDIFEYRDGEFKFKKNTMIPDVPRPGGRYKVPFFSVSEKRLISNAVCITFELPCDGNHYEDSMETLKKIAENFSIISAAIIKPWHEQVMTVTGITSYASANLIKKERIKDVHL